MIWYKFCQDFDFGRETSFCKKIYHFQYSVIHKKTQTIIKITVFV